MSIRKGFLAIILTLLAALEADLRVIDNSDEGFPSTQPNNAARYANPLVLENAGRLADPTVIKWQEDYYLYLTGGLPFDAQVRAAVWSSKDLVHWEYH